METKAGLMLGSKVDSLSWKMGKRAYCALSKGGKDQSLMGSLVAGASGKQDGDAVQISRWML